MSNWQELATRAAQAVGLDPRILLSMVEAETNGRNVSGDSGESFGFGQVQPKWHYAELVQAAHIVGVNPPAPPKSKTAAGVTHIGQVVLNNDLLSMTWAALVVKKYWIASGQKFDVFVHGYVGPKVPDREVQRRSVIWKKYFGQAPPVIPSVNPSGGQQDGVFKFTWGSVPVVVLIGAAAVALVAVASD